MAWQEEATNPWTGRTELCYTRLGEFHVVDGDRVISARWHRYASKEAFDAAMAGTTKVVYEPSAQLVVQKTAGQIPHHTETAEGTLTKHVPMPSYDQVRDGVRLKVVEGEIKVVLPDGTVLDIEPVAEDGSIALFDAVATTLYELSEPLFPGAEKV